MTPIPIQPVVRAVRFFFAHTPGLVRHGSKPTRDAALDPGLPAKLRTHFRSYGDAVAYPPHRVLLGDIAPGRLDELPRPWFGHRLQGPNHGPHGEFVPETAFLGLLSLFDPFDLVSLNSSFVEEVRPEVAAIPAIGAAEAGQLQYAPEAAETGAPEAVKTGAWEGGSITSGGHGAPVGSLPLELADGRAAGFIRAGHGEDPTLGAGVLLENLCCKVTAAMALRGLVREEGIDPETIPYLLNCGEEAVGDRYQRGGGNLAKAVAELAGCRNATGVDVKGFCCGPVHALMLAGSLVGAGVFPRVAVVAGCSLAKLGMKYRGHLQERQPILEDVLAGLAVLVEADDGRSPVLRIDGMGLHTVAAGASQKEIFEHLVGKPLQRAGLSFSDVDKYATELHNPELTEPAGSGNVPLINYRTIGGLAVLKGEIPAAGLPAFVAAHGMPGFAPTQGHFASAVAYLGHALDGLKGGSLRRVMLLAKGSLFLGRMTQMSDGVSIMLERNE